MNMITAEALKFLDDARESFIKEDQQVTYKSDEFMALRTGFRDDNIEIYRLNGEVGNFVEQLPKQHKILVDYDEVYKLKQLQEFISEIRFSPNKENAEKEVFKLAEFIKEIGLKLKDIKLEG